MLCLWLLTFLNISFCLASIQFNCTAGESKKVVYQCTVDQGFVLGWKIEDENGKCYRKEYTYLDQVNNATKVLNAPDFTTTLLSNMTVPLISTISFTLNTNLTGYIIGCYDVSGNTTECKILAPPSAPSSFNCTNITNDSLTLQWGEPTDNGGEEVLQYNITGTPGDISRTVESRNNVTVKYLEPNMTYNFSIRASNSVGFGSRTSVVCTTERNTRPPPMFSNVMVCLDFNATDGNDLNHTLVVEALPCPLSKIAVDFTPEITNYTLNLNGTFKDVNEDPGMCNFTATVNPGVYTIDVCASNNVGTSKTSYNNGAVFYALWLRDVHVMDITNSSAAIHYTTADCVERDELLDIELIAPSFTTVDHDYYVNTSSSFSLTSLMQNDNITFTLQVVVISTSVTVFSTIGSFIVSPTPTPIGSTSVSTEPTGSPGGSSNMLPIIGGAVGAILAIVAIIIVILAVIACYVYYKNKKNKTSGSSSDPIPLRETKRPLPETGQALYQERQQAPTGDMYAQPQKKPLYSKVDKANKGSPAELGSEDGSQPPISPSGQPLLPKIKHK